MKYKGYILPDPISYQIMIEIDSEFNDMAVNGKRLKTKGGIIITEEYAKKDAYGECIATIVAFGPDCYNKKFLEKTATDKAWCKVGDTVMLQAHSGRIIPTFGQDFVHGRFQLVTDQAFVAIYKDKELKELREKL